MWLGRTARGRSFVYHVAGVDGVGGSSGSQGGMVSWPHVRRGTGARLHAPSRLPAVVGACGPRGTVVREGRKHGVGPPPTPCSTIQLAHLATVRRC